MNNISVPVLRPPVVETIVPHYGDRNGTTQVILSGQRLGLSQEDLISVIVGGQRCPSFVHLMPTTDMAAVIYVHIPPAELEAPSPAVYDVMLRQEV